MTVVNLFFFFFFSFFPLLGLFLDFDDRLPLVGNLVHLVSWSRIVDSLLSRRLSRKDINKKIGDVIREKAKSPAEREQLKEAFENFTAAFAPYLHNLNG